jgi:hypothetical protein
MTPRWAGPRRPLPPCHRSRWLSGPAQTQDTMAQVLAVSERAGLADTPEVADASAILVSGLPPPAGRRWQQRSQRVHPDASDADRLHRSAAPRSPR